MENSISEVMGTFDIPWPMLSHVYCEYPMEGIIIIDHQNVNCTPVQQTPGWFNLQIYILKERETRKKEEDNRWNSQDYEKRASNAEELYRILTTNLRNKYWQEKDHSAESVQR